jgi:hypothetical protein
MTNVAVPNWMPVFMLHVTTCRLVKEKHMKGSNMGGVVECVNKYRAKLRKEGMRPLQIWVPDTSRSGFAEECKRQSELVKNDPHEKEILKLLDESADRAGRLA